MQLINAADGYHLWSESYDRDLTDLFALQDDIAQAVVSALKIRLLSGTAPSTRYRTRSSDAYTLYLRGRQLSNLTTPDGFRRAAEAYESALALEPGFAPAWAGLAQANYWMAYWDEKTAEIAEARRRAFAAAEKAVALGPELPEAYAARGVIRCATRHEWRGAKADLERALALSPENPDVLRDYALFALRPFGRTAEAVGVARRLAALDPLNGRAWGTLGTLLTDAGDLREAREVLARSLEVNPEQAFTPYILGVAFLTEHRPADALAAFQRSTSPLRRLTGVAVAQHSLGHATESQAALDELVARFSESGAYRIAVVHAWRGEKDLAFQWLDRASALRDAAFLLVKTDPLLRGLHEDPRFPALLQKSSLPVE
jgi:serine/threonine-protein kinase